MNTDQGIANNNAFNAATKYLSQHGYGQPKFVKGHPLSLLAQEPIAVTIPFVGPDPKNPKTIDKAKATLQYAKLGFSLADQGGHLSITHPGQDETLEALTQLIKDNQLDYIEVTTDDSHVIVATKMPLSALTPQQARQLADALTQAATHVESNLTPP